MGVFDTGGARIIKTVDRVRAAVVDKADQTRGALKPVLVAVNAHGTFVDQNDLYSSIYGDEAINFVADGSRDDYQKIRTATGFWTERSLGRRSHVSAILTAENMAPWSIGRSEPVLWINPWATMPIAWELPVRRIEIDVEVGKIMDSPARQPIHEVLGLSPIWPESGGPWDE